MKQKVNKGFDEKSVLDTGDFSKATSFSIDVFMIQVLNRLPSVFDGEVSAGDALQKYRHLVEHLEVVAIAGKIVEADYFKDAEEKIESSDSSDKSMKIARGKLSFLMSAIRKNGPSTAPLKI